ncbi:hypothetical protein WBP06_18375 (plasmid) [Novosphingobium sp. BL-8H]|uniref:hypothetical protein n=1 Tax=Novosphingobium sp. BL-8H TaxID=3127640 RepID=UPI003757CB8C
MLPLAVVIGTVIAGIMLLVVGILIVQLVLMMLRLAAVVGLASLICGGIGFGLSLAGMDTGPSVLIGLVAFPLALWALWRGFWPRRYTRPLKMARAVTPVYGGVVEGPADAELTRAWEQLTQWAPDEHAASLFEARSTCVEMLRVAEQASYDLEIIACAVFIRRNVPELAARNAQLWETADAALRAELSYGITEDVARFGAYAARELERVRREFRRSHGDGLVALRNHIAARTDA